MATTFQSELEIRKKSIVICIPAYNEEKTIAKIIIDAKKFSDKIIVVDDGSTDYTPKIVKELGVMLIQHKTNLGKGDALTTGFKRALIFSPDIVVTIDGDGQHDPSFIPSLIEPILKGEVDVVIGSRSKNTKMPAYRKKGLELINALNKKAGKLKINDTQSGFRAYSKVSIQSIAKEKFDSYSADFEIIEAIAKNGFGIKEVPIQIKYDGLDNTSKKNFLTHGGELILSSIFMIISRRPILYLALPGTILLIIGLIFGLQTISLFNESRYFSIPMSILGGSLVILGSMFIFSAMFIFILSKLRIFEKR